LLPRKKTRFEPRLGHAEGDRLMVWFWNRKKQETVVITEDITYHPVAILNKESFDILIAEFAEEQAKKSDKKMEE